jgi:hypothetical protein
MKMARDEERLSARPGENTGAVPERSSVRTNRVPVVGSLRGLSEIILPAEGQIIVAQERGIIRVVIVCMLALRHGRSGFGSG